MSGELTQLSLEEWQGFIGTDPRATPFHHRNWIELIAEQYRLKVEIPALVQGKVITALPFIETRSISGRRQLVSLPFTDCMQVLTTDDSSIPRFVRALQQEQFGRGRPVLVTTDQPLDCQSRSDRGFRHDVSLTGSIDDVVSAYSASVRQNLRRAGRQSLRYERRDDAAAVDVFYRLHLLTRRKLGVPVQPKAFFRRLLERIIRPGLGTIALVLDGQSAVAGAVFLEFNRTVIYKYGASDPAALHLRPNEFLFDRAIREACENGYRRFDFGVTAGSEEGLRRFKRKWGTSETAVSCFALAGRARDSLKSSLAARLASAMIRRSPTFVCRVFGEAFYKYVH